MNLDKTREDFPLFRQDNPPAYLDNACVTLKPDSVIETIHDYYTMNPGCAGKVSSPLRNQGFIRCNQSPNSG